MINKINVESSKLLTVIVVFFNAEREAPRTLYTLSTKYQRGLPDTAYDVVVLDNGSQIPLQPDMVKAFGPQFHYKYIDTKSHSPCGAIMQELKQVKTPYVMCMIDGAHMLSPRVLQHSLKAVQVFPNPFVYTIPLHLGEQMQNDNMMTGYNQEVEDRLLKTVSWRKNGYNLFSISNIAVSMNSFFGKLTESNCFVSQTETLLAKGGFDERFSSPGGGMVNLDIFKNMVEDKDIQPVVLVGEASFHQFHGGISTNVPRKEHPLVAYRKEYKAIRHKKYQRPEYEAFYFGHIPEACKSQAFRPTAKVIVELGRRFLNEGKAREAIAVFGHAKKLQPYTPNIFIDIGEAHEKNNNLEAAEKNYRRAIEINPITTGYYYIKLGTVLLEQGKKKAAFEYFQEALKIDAEDAKMYVAIGKAHQKVGEGQQAKNSFELALKYLELYPAINVGFYIMLGRTFFELKDNKNALAVFGFGLQQFDDDPRLLFWESRVFMRKDEPAKAEEKLQKALQQSNANKTQILKLLGALYKREKRWGDAVLAFHKVLQLNPNDAKSITLLEECKQHVHSDLSKEKYKSFIFTHIPKSGGMSFREHLLEAGIRSGIDPQSIYTPGSNNIPAQKNLIQLDEKELAAIRKKNLIILADHSSYSPVKTYQLNTLHDPFYYVVFREPLARIKSYYYYFYYRNGLEGLKGIHLNDMDDVQLDWILGVFSNWQVAYMTDHNRDKGIDIDETIFKKACKNLEQQYACFGIFEQMDYSMKIFQQHAPTWLKFAGELPKLNRNTPVKDSIELSSRVIERIKKFNQWDIAFYDFALKLFKKRYQ